MARRPPLAPLQPLAPPSGLSLPYHHTHCTCSRRTVTTLLRDFSVSKYNKLNILTLVSRITFLDKTYCEPLFANSMVCESSCCKETLLQFCIIYLMLCRLYCSFSHVCKIHNTFFIFAFYPYIITTTEKPYLNNDHNWPTL